MVYTPPGMRSTKPRLDPMLVSFSGIDGCGKSTQIERLSALLEEAGLDPVRLWSRGGYTTGMLALKRLARRVAGRKLPPAGRNEERAQAMQRTWVAQIWLTLAMLDLIRVYGGQLRWWKLRGRPVLADRYLWDTLVDFKMQFSGIDVESKLLWRVLERLAARPRRAIFLHLDPSVAEVRSVQKGDPWLEPLSERERRRRFYEEQVARGRFDVVDAAEAPDAVAAAIRALLAIDSWRA